MNLQVIAWEKNKTILLLKCWQWGGFFFFLLDSWVGFNTSPTPAPKYGLLEVVEKYDFHLAPTFIGNI